MEKNCSQIVLYFGIYAHLRKVSPSKRKLKRYRWRYKSSAVSQMQPQSSQQLCLPFQDFRQYLWQMPWLLAATHPVSGNQLCQNNPCYRGVKPTSWACQPARGEAANNPPNNFFFTDTVQAHETADYLLTCSQVASGQLQFRYTYSAEVFPASCCWRFPSWPNVDMLTLICTNAFTLFLTLDDWI